MVRRFLLHGLFALSLVFPLFVLLNFVYEVDFRRFGNEYILAVCLVGIPAIAGIVVTLWAIGSVIQEGRLARRSKALLLLSFFCLNSIAAFLYLRKKV